MRSRLFTSVWVLAVASILGFAAVAQSSVSAHAAKKCAKGKALNGSKCVKKCPSGKVKKKIKGRLKCVAKKPAAGPTAPAGGTAPPITTTPTVAPPPAPTQVQLTRNDDAGRAALGAGDLFLERGSCASVTCEYYRIFFYGNGTYRSYAVDWNNVSGEICRAGSKLQGSWAFAEGYTFTERGGGTVVKLTTNDVLVFSNAEPDNVYIYSVDKLIRFDKNPNMLDSC